jgi:TolA-binding protein
MGEYSTARDIITEWVSNSPGHPLQPEAHVFLGDLDAMDAAVESALLYYAQVEPLGGSQALIDHAYFESASLLLANRRYAEHDELLLRYLDHFPESPAAAEAVLRLAEANLPQGRIRKAFEYYRDGIERFGDGIATDHVDQLIDAWWDTDTEVRQRSVQTSAFIERLLTDEAFRSEMLFNRVAQIGYFNEHPQIPKTLQEALVIRQPLYQQLIEETTTGATSAGEALDLLDFETLRVIQRGVAAQLSQLPEAAPASVFTEMRESALAVGKDALALRLLRILNLRADVEVSPAQLGQAEADLASPATLVWIARIKAQDDAFTARAWLKQVIELAPYSSAAASALFELGQLDMELGYFDQAADFYGQIIDNYFGDPQCRRAAMLRADALRSARRYEDAVDAYSLIINQRDWRGVLWAEATFKIGLCFLQLDETGKAQGFFERTYLAYAGYPEWSAKAVLESGQLLEDQGESESARNTYQFFLDLPRAEESPLYDVIRQHSQSL